MGQEDSLEKEMAIHSSILAWEIPWTEEPGRLRPWGHKELDTTERLSMLSMPGTTQTPPEALIPCLGRFPGEGNGNPLQYACLENSMDRGTWWATVDGVAKSQTQLGI